jgi:hypothetical protein
MRTLSRLVLTLFCFVMLIPPALAVDTPTLDDIVSPIDASKAVISGTTGADYKVVVTGGTSQISPVYADSSGYFEITVALIQETTNNFSIKVEDEDGNSSDLVSIVIVEGVAEAAEAESSGGGDHTAPGAPDVDEYPEAVDADSYTFTGYGEASTTVTETYSDESAEVDSDGYFEITLDLEQDTDNTFKLILEDDAGNISASTKIEIEESSEGEEVVVEEEDTEAEVVVIALSDISEHWAEDYIIELVTDGVVEGYDDGTFLPDSPINRAEFTKIVLGALGFEISEDVPESAFTDAPNGTWYTPYTQAAYEEGIVEGYDDGTFGAANYINRAEAVKILLEAAGVDVTESLIEFDDVDEDAWYAPYVATAYSMGIISGYADGNFGPSDNMTRAQVCKVIVELLAQI